MTGAKAALVITAASYLWNWPRPVALPIAQTIPAEIAGWSQGLERFGSFFIVAAIIAYYLLKVWPAQRADERAMQDRYLASVEKLSADHLASMRASTEAHMASVRHLTESFAKEQAATRELIFRARMDSH